MSVAEPPQEILSSVYPQLRRMAAARMHSEMPGQTIQPTALVHEAWMRLAAHETRTWWEDPKKLFAAAATAMRRILIDRARQRAELKRGGKWVRVPMDAADSVQVDADEKMLLIHEALGHLEAENPDHARVVILKIFGGLSIPEIAAEMKIAERTVHRYWARAKVWLYEAIVDGR
jgi:RNA polymerase sigma factor, TIGR02999 family